MVKDSDVACCNSRAPQESRVAHSREVGCELVTMALLRVLTPPAPSAGHPINRGQLTASGGKRREVTEAQSEAVTVTGASAGHPLTRMEVTVAWHRDLRAPVASAGHLMYSGRLTLAAAGGSKQVHHCCSWADPLC